MRRIGVLSAVSVVLLALVAMPVLANGQQEAQEEADEPVKVVFWSGITDDRGPGLMMEEWNSQNPDVELEHVRFVNNDDGNTKLDTAIISGQQVDIYVNYNNDLAVRRFNNGMGEDLQPYVDEDGWDLDAAFGDVIRGAYVDDQLAFLPSSVAYNVVYYNQTAFEEKGITIPENWTWDDYADIALQMTEGEGTDRKYGSMFFPWGPVMFGSASVDLGPNARYDDDGLSNFDHPVYRKLLGAHVRMEQVDQSQMPLYEMISSKARPFDEFLKGNTYMFGVTNPWVMRYIKDTESYPHDFVTAIAPAPWAFSDGEHWDSGGIVDRLMMNPNAENKDAVWDVMQYLATEGSWHNVAFGRLPSWTQFDSEEVAVEFLGDAAESLIDVESFMKYQLPENPRFPIDTMFTAAPEIDQITSEEYEKALLGEISVDEALENMKRRADAAIRAARSREE